VLCFGDSLDFLVSDAETSHYIWDYNLDEIVTVTEDNSAEARLAFNSSGVYDIMVVEFNEILCAGDTMVFHVQVLEELVPVFSYSIEDANIVNFNNESSGAETYFWDFGDGMYSEDMNPVHSYAENGTYDVSLTITNALGCEEVFTTSISIIELNTNQYSMSQFLCYPNPFNNQLNIQIPFKNATVEVRDVTGKRISITESSNEIEIIDTESWSSGVYFVTAKDTQGNFLVQKVAKK
jgi:PKD repeat protein